MQTERLAIGETAEVMVKAEIVGLGYVVSTPDVTAAYDLVVDLGDELVKLQCKSAHVIETDKRKTYGVDMRKTGRFYDGSAKDDSYTGDEVDAFAIYNPEFDETYWLWFEEAPSRNTDRTLESWRDHLVEEKMVGR